LLLICFLGGNYQQLNFTFNPMGLSGQKARCGFIKERTYAMEPITAMHMPSRPKASMSLCAICISRQIRQSLPAGTGWPAESICSWSYSTMTKTPAQMTANTSHAVAKRVKMAIFCGFFTMMLIFYQGGKIVSRIRFAVHENQFSFFHNAM